MSTRKMSNIFSRYGRETENHSEIVILLHLSIRMTENKKTALRELVRNVEELKLSSYLGSENIK